MRLPEALRVLADVTAYQWGMVTTAQASEHGVTRLDISRLSKAGHLERLAHGIYKIAGAPGDQFDDLRVAWLSTDPKRTADARLKDLESEVVFAGASAARLHDIGDLWDRRHDFISPTRRQTQRREIRYRRRRLQPDDIALVEGLPALSIECTIADLFDAEADISHIADALRDASAKHRLDIERLRELLSPHAKGAGFGKDDGAALLQHLMELAGIDADALAGRIATTPEIGSRVASKYLELLSDLKRRDVRDRDAAPEVLSEYPSALDEAARVQLLTRIEPHATKELRAATRPMVRDSGIEDALRGLTATQTRPAQTGFSLTPEVMRMIENAQKAVRNA